MSPDEEEKHRRFLRQFAAYESSIHAYVRRLVPRREDALDVMQDVSVVLWKKFDQLEEEGDFRRWAFGVAKFQVLAWRRDLARERERLVLSPETIELMAEESEAEAEQLDLEREAILQHCLGQLKSEQRQALEEMYRSNSQAEELAAQFGRSVSGFYQWLYRIRQSLSDCATQVSEREWARS
ncbi:MAG: sigma-70 family RNA polymerase sigma factor [Verrucomicrobiota bacterium]